MFQINQLIIIGGPSRAGKSFLIEKIQQGKCPHLCEQLGIMDPSSWNYLHVNSLKKNQQPMLERLVVHYDSYAQYSQKNGFHYLSELVTNSNNVVVLTLHASPEILIQRSKSKLLKTLKSLFFLNTGEGKCLFKVECRVRQWQKIKRFWKKQRAYQKGFSGLLYEKWFEFFRQNYVTAHWVLDSNQSNSRVAHPYRIGNSGIFSGIKDEAS